MKRDKKGRFIKKKIGYDRKIPIKKELKDIIDRIEHIRWKNHLSRTKFCEGFGMAPQTYNNFIGKQGGKPSIELILGVCDIYNVESFWLLTGKGFMRSY